ncbi:MAG TPA: TonB-dependent receptor, partial [Kofleriaceae bacterium]|nr:TonB-dependent receptor [Kofleriaceae bacterium]
MAVAPTTIVVVGSRSEIPETELPLPVTVIDLEPLEGAREGTSLGEVLEGVPGLVARNRSNFAQDLRLSLRGFGARSPFGIRGVTIVLDGIPLTMADGQAQVDVVDPSMLSRVEVLRGPAGALYGNGAGGVVYLDTGDGRTRPGADAAVELGAFGTRKLMARAAGEAGAAAWTASVSRLDADGYRQRAAVEQTLAHGKASWRVAPGLELRLVATYLDSPVAEDSGGLTADEMRDDPSRAAPSSITFATGEAVREPQVGGAVAWRPSADDLVEATAYLDARDFTGSVPTRIVELDHIGLGAGARYRSTRAIAGVPARLTAGVDAQHMRDRRKNFDNEGGAAVGGATLRQDERVDALGAYGQAHVELGARLGLLAGARYDHTRFALDDRLVSDGDQSGERAFDNAAAMAGAIVTPRAGLDVDVYANVAQSIETPTVTELAVRPDGAAGFNPDLQAQRATSLELGARGRHGRLSGELAAFHIALHDELIPFEDETGRTFYRNAARSHRDGAEAAATLALPAGLDLRASYGYLRARFDANRLGGQDLAGNAVPGIPPHQLAASLSWRGASGLFASGQLSYLHRTFVDDANTARARASVLVDATAGYRGRRGSLRYELHVGAANLFDRVYADNLRVNADGGRYFEPGPPLHFFAG